MHISICFCPRCGRHARMSLSGGEEDENEVHVACKEHALLFVRGAVIHGMDISDEEVARLTRLISDSSLPPLEKASEKRLYHIELVNLSHKDFRTFSLDKLCITIFLISPKRIPKNYKKEIRERLSAASPN